MSRAISTIVGTAIFILIATAILAIIVIAFDMFRQLNEVYNRIFEMRMHTIEIANSITGWWLYQDYNLTIHLESNYPRGAQLIAVAIVLSNGTTIALHKDDTKNAWLELQIPSGQIVEEHLNLPLGIGPGYRLNISIYLPELASEAVNVSGVSVALTSSIVTVIHLERLKTTTTTSGIQAPSPPYTSANLARISFEGTVTWYGITNIPQMKIIAGDIRSLQTISGTIEPTTPSALEYLDNNTVMATPILDIVRIERNAIYYDDFATNPIGTQFIVESGSWYYDSVNHAIYIRFAGGRSLNYGYFNINVSEPMYVLVNTEYHIEYPAILWLLRWGILYGYDNETKSTYLAYLEEVMGIRRISYYIGISDNTVYSTSTIQRNNINRISPGVRYQLQLYWNPNTGFHRVELYEGSPSLLAYVEAYDDTYRSGLIGLYVYTSWLFWPPSFSIYFYDIVVSRVSPLWVNITNIPRGWGVELIDANGYEIASGIDNDYDGVVSLFVGHNPIVRDGTICIYNPENPDQRFCKTFSNDVIVGGDVYSVKYAVEFVERISFDVSDVVEVRELVHHIYLRANTSLDIELSIYNTSAGRYDVIEHDVYTDVGEWSFINISIPIRYLDISTSPTYIELKILLYSNNGFLAELDVSNTNMNALIRSAETPTLLVGVGGSRYIDVYEVIGNETVWIRSIDSASLFNGSVDIVFDYVTGRLFMVNNTDLYNTTLNSNVWTELNSGIRVGPGVRMEIVNTSSSSYLIILPGDIGSNSNLFYIVDTRSGRVVNSSAIGLEDIVEHRYMVSAADIHHGIAYFLVFNSTASKAVIIYFNLSDYLSGGNPWHVLGDAPCLNAVGMAYGGGYLWLMCERGSLYKIDVDTGSYELVDVQLPFYPIGYGDRLEYVDGRLLFVRADGTNEIWIITPPS